MKSKSNRNWFWQTLVKFMPWRSRMSSNENIAATVTDNLPPYLILWRTCREQSRADQMTVTYLHSLRQFTTFQQAHKYRWDDTTNNVRNQILEYLTNVMECVVQHLPDRNGMQISKGPDTKVMDLQVGIFLAAIRDFYEIMIITRTYHDFNPTSVNEVHRRIWPSDIATQVDVRPPAYSPHSLSSQDANEMSTDYFRWK